MEFQPGGPCIGKQQQSARRAGSRGRLAARMADGGGGKLALGAMLKASAAQQMLQVNTIYRFLVVRWLVVLET